MDKVSDVAWAHPNVDTRGGILYVCYPCSDGMVVDNWRNFEPARARRDRMDIYLTNYLVMVL